jgi:hypothetical protein
MSTPPITLVTAAAGKTGRQTALALLARGLPVRAMVHRDDARAAELRGRGAEVVVGNVSDVGDVRRAIRGVQAAYWAAPVTPGALEAAMSVLTKTMITAAPNEKRYLRAYQDGATFGLMAADSDYWHATHAPDRRPMPAQPAVATISSLAR